MGDAVRDGGVVTVLGGVPTAFRPLRHRDFRLLWTGLAISLVGSGLWLVALAWQVIELGGGPTELSLVTALFSVGLLAFVLIGGVAADRLPQRLVMLAADLVRAAVLLVGAAGALGISSGRLPRRYLSVMLLMWGLGSLPFAAVGLSRLAPDETRAFTEDALAEAAAGRLRPVIGQTFPLDRAADAHAAIESRATVGKTLLIT